MFAALTPGSSAGYSAKSIPAGTLPPVGNPATWTSSDEKNAPVTVDEGNPTGLTARVTTPKDAVVGTKFTLTVTYTNPDGKEVIQTIEDEIVGEPSGDITGFDIARSY